MWSGSFSQGRGLAPPTIGIPQTRSTPGATRSALAYPAADRLPAPDGAESGPNNGSGSLQATRPTSFRFVRARRRRDRDWEKIK